MCRQQHTENWLVRNLFLLQINNDRGYGQWNGFLFSVARMSLPPTDSCRKEINLINLLNQRECWSEPPDTFQNKTRSGQIGGNKRQYIWNAVLYKSFTWLQKCLYFFQLCLPPSVNFKMVMYWVLYLATSWMAPIQQKSQLTPYAGKTPSEDNGSPGLLTHILLRQNPHCPMIALLNEQWFRSPE